MKTKRFIIIISCIFVLLIISIGIYLYINKDMPTKAVITDYTKRIGNVNIEAKEDIIKNNRINLTLTGTSEGEFTIGTSTGDFYKIYCLKNGEWKEVRPKKVGNTTESIIEVPSKNKTLEGGVDWSRTHGKLEKGKYRYEEEFSIADFGSAGGGIRDKFYIEFELY